MDLEAATTKGAMTSRPTTPEEPGYVNPLEKSSRRYLSARANIIRHAASLGMSIANRTFPPAPSPTRDVWFDSTLSEKFKGPDAIKAEVWIPPKPAPAVVVTDSDGNSNNANGNGSGSGSASVGGSGIQPRCAIINCHGGGWILGQGTDDSRWAGLLMTSLDAVVFTVNYRLAPAHPFPTAVEDCVDVACQIAQRATEFGIDPNRIILSGFSAGGTNSLTSWIVMQEPERFGYTLPCPPPTVVGLVLFYPGLDWTMSRPTKRKTCSRPDLTLSRGLTDLIDASYIYPPLPREKRTDLRLSPGLMPDSLLRRLPPIHLCLCEYDMLLAEGLRFANRLSIDGLPIRCRIVEGEKHAWDNPPPMSLKPSVWAEYAAAIQSIADWLGVSNDTDKESLKSLKKKRPILKKPSHMSFRSVRSAFK
ncbi:Carboxylesterase family [Geosmithia morbida]|uniref:Carboxylesterase family n=1 Tax=Geosmithia morbida TaxID=1094350 RepID=A0A9P5D655_9HYPO|nr:Carboxylesterase family [Geosmithia morbida]KAF4125266.1 Carboxylesterase family [Geosmithia morbida]